MYGGLSELANGQSFERQTETRRNLKLCFELKLGRSEQIRETCQHGGKLENCGSRSV